MRFLNKLKHSNLNEGACTVKYRPPPQHARMNGKDVSLLEKALAGTHEHLQVNPPHLDTL